MSEKRTRMRPQVESVYSRQVAKCLDDIAELYELPSMVVERIKRAVEYTCKDVDKLRLKKGTPYGNETTEISGNR